MSRHEVTPWQQGELDGLCGLYAIINAMKLLAASRGHNFTDSSGAELFRQMVRSLHKRNLLPNALWDGTSIMHVRNFLGGAKTFMRRNYGLDLVYSQLARKGEITRKDVFWRFLDSALAGDGMYDFRFKTPYQRVALLGLGDPLPHWTLAYGVTASSIKLIDSGSRFSLKYSACTVGESQPNHWMIEPEHTLVIATV